MTISLLRSIEEPGASYDVLLLWCPGCATLNDFGLHMIPVSDTKGKRPQWAWNGSLDKPDLKPSIKTDMGTEINFLCHSFLNDGVWDFLNDSTHTLAGQKVPVMDLPDWVL